ncbi:MSMEG_1061 family FMN-dependent PPOX-type flavoprotein [Sabulicella glaciei]|uniref:Pyridoxamine 5'-phosphate oxidase family protein n=1 Tax=Sabulicella glaciei TaxID=2984948 RepID=A0ABT3P0Y3_9PROT|nr:MSMEG_1061 family FMN-dependent PPOX-type flavoprotein [Roseococcus sp. MDT2-1-1]MCW8088061.1 pyridoxamine 5'-phosphate oxidase family protein [Roseococcus sp. MDT2-1-1]
MDALTDPHAITSLAALDALYAEPSELVRKKVAPQLDAPTRAFIAASPFVLLGTVGPDGPHVTPRGDAPGFVEAPDDETLILPDRRGNNRLDALRDILVDDRVALLFLVPGAGETLRVHGRATITTDPALRARHVAQGKEPTSLLRVRVTSLYMQCAKAVIRSKLWAGAPRPAELPSMGALLEAHMKGAVKGEEVDARLPVTYAQTLY